MSRPIRKFCEILGLLDRGRFEEACDDAIRDSVEFLEALPKESGKATITVEIEVAFDKGRIDVTPKLKTKLPDDKKFGRTPFWATEGALSTQHPSQLDMLGPREAADDIVRERA